MAITKSKIRGMLLGVCIGDAFGAPFESKPFEIVKQIKKIENYRSGRMGKGCFTDDGQLTIAVAKALISANGFDMDEIANQHVVAYKDTVSGWGSTTREAIKKIAEGVNWSKSGDFGGAINRGLGNGVPMKVAPLAAYLALQNVQDFTKNCVDFTAMTHQTSIAVSSCLAHVTALVHCLGTSAVNFNTKEFLDKLVAASDLGRGYYPETFKDNITDKIKGLQTLYQNPKLLYSDEHLVNEYGGGTCYVYNSLPLSYAFFIRGPFKVQSMVDVAYVGGDSDTNASMVGGLLGALCGESVFPQHLVDGLDKKEEIVGLADSLFEKFASQSEVS